MTKIVPLPGKHILMKVPVRKTQLLQKTRRGNRVNAGVWSTLNNFPHYVHDLGLVEFKERTGTPNDNVGAGRIEFDTNADDLLRHPVSVGHSFL